MNEQALTTAVMGNESSRASFLEQNARKIIESRLKLLSEGQLSVSDGEQTRVFGRLTPDYDLQVRVSVSDPKFWVEALLGGTVGVAEAYMDGLWSADDLPGLARLFVRNRHAMEGLEGGLARLRGPARALYHFWQRRNTRAGARRNIAAHYDLGNEFFQTFLDPTMTYSCALFERDDATLYEASLAKIDRLCKKLALRPGDHLLEIGTGWGAFAIHAASRYGCNVTTTTISEQQYELALERVRKAGLAKKVTVLFEDYRDLAGAYDKIVSVEMVEAIGERYLDTYFSKCASLLKPDGAMAIQAITIQDQLYDQAAREVDFIKRYVFPGSFIPSLTKLSESITRASDLKTYHLEDIGPHYAKTLELWRKRFLSNASLVRAQGYSEEFIRMWEWYLAYCEGGFEERQLGTVQMLLTKPHFRRAPITGTIRWADQVDS